MGGGKVTSIENEAQWKELVLNSAKPVRGRYRPRSESEGAGNERGRERSRAKACARHDPSHARVRRSSPPMERRSNRASKPRS
eukprot:scaffold31_cov334-Pavlova_lutheri.AAC.45